MLAFVSEAAHTEEAGGMCRFFSGIALENGDLITSDYTDSHDLLLRAGGICDGHVQHGRFARVDDSLLVRVEVLP